MKVVRHGLAIEFRNVIAGVGVFQRALTCRFGRADNLRPGETTRVI